MCAGLSTLDNLVANGVLNFDADAYVRGQGPRYMGNPFGTQELPFDQPICPSPYPYYGGGYVPMMSSQPRADAFINRFEHSDANSLKEVLVYGGIAGLIIYGIHKANKLGEFIKDVASNIGKKKAPAAVATKPTDTKAGTDAANRLADAAKGGWFKRNIFNKAAGKKIGAWALGGVVILGALSVVRSLFRKKPKELTPEQMQMLSQQLQAQPQAVDPTTGQPQVAQAVEVAPAGPAPAVQTAQQAPQPATVAQEPQPAPVVQVAQQTPVTEPAPEIQPVPPVQA